MKLHSIKLLVLAVLVLSTSVAHGLTFDQVLVERWVGAGSSRALLVVDFGAKSFAFGYCFDGQQTGWDLIRTVADATELDVAVDMSWGSPFITGISYQGFAGYYDPQNWQTSRWWEYWNSADGETWASSWVGCSDRVLADGAWDGWTFSPPWPEQGTPPKVPLVPEPSTLGGAFPIIGLAVFKLLRRK
ncbi:MAG: hypothetical protein QHI38_02995 [Armatimonadota bacterium]|nr:hypothetical protein [Armatimonadota bacterium]